MLMGFFLFVESLHMVEHEHCRPVSVTSLNYSP